MTAASLSKVNDSHLGIRPIDPKRDMGAIADLIESAFPLDFDPEGRRMVRDMRAYSRAGLLGYWIGRLILPPAAYPLGYVWEQDGIVVGNASLLRVDGFPQRWVLANVVVKEDYRRRGIGRELTKASIELAKERKARELFLQVDSNNKGAQILYADLGFHPHSTRKSWTRSSNQPIQASIEYGRARERQEGDWKTQLELAERLHPEGVVWPYPLTSRLYHPPILERFLSMTAVRHWVWEEEGRLMGTLTARSRVESRKLRFILIVDPERRGSIERPLLKAGVRAFQSNNLTIQMDYPVGSADRELRDMGFKTHRTLTWMSMDL